jgi:hypothetical protein
MPGVKLAAPMNMKLASCGLLACAMALQSAPWATSVRAGSITPADAPRAIAKEACAWGYPTLVEPIVLTVPPIEETRTWSLQLIDRCTHHFDDLGTRTTGSVEPLSAFLVQAMPQPAPAIEILDETAPAMHLNSRNMPPTQAVQQQ